MAVGSLEPTLILRSSYAKRESTRSLSASPFPSLPACLSADPEPRSGVPPTFRHSNLPFRVSASESQPMDRRPRTPAAPRYNCSSPALRIGCRTTRLACRGAPFGAQIRNFAVVAGRRAAMHLQRKTVVDRYILSPVGESYQPFPLGFQGFRFQACNHATLKVRAQSVRSHGPAV